MYVLESDPRLIAGSRRRRWNVSLLSGHPLEIDADLWRDIDLALHVTGSGFRTESRAADYGEQPGQTGSMTIAAPGGVQGEARTAFGGLARFAECCGTGVQVTHGPI